MTGGRDPIAAWLATLREGWGDEPSDALAQALAAPIRQLLAGGTEPEEAFRELGRVAGSAGCPVHEVAGWTQALLDTLTRRQARRWDRHDLAAQVVAGWVEETLARSSNDTATSPAALVLRLGELYDHCTALGADPRQAYALVILDVRSAPDPESTERLARATLRVELGDPEVLALARPGRLVAAVPRTERLAVQVRAIAHALEASTGGSVRAWVEPLGSDRDHMAAHVAALAL